MKHLVLLLLVVVGLFLLPFPTLAVRRLRAKRKKTKAPSSRPTVPAPAPPSMPSLPPSAPTGPTVEPTCSMHLVGDLNSHRSQCKRRPTCIWSGVQCVQGSSSPTTPTAPTTATNEGWLCYNGQVFLSTAFCPLKRIRKS